MPDHPLASRTDIADELIHLIRRPTYEEAFAVLTQIVMERRLRGGNGYIRGGFQCVCFTEAPLESIAEVVWENGEDELKFQPFGIVVKKAWLFERGGRPVIYQPDSEYALLPEELRYRHVRYEPDARSPIDLTWEREWRIKTDNLYLDPQNCEIVVLSADHQVRLEAVFAEQHREAFPWKVFVVGPTHPDEHIDLIANMGYYDR